ncbi:hypothetical protein R1sor_020247 [Riccia sorocarpa]|uniref:Chlororespiratory reduction 6 n=1 Tax=Riccia sorocarpa TaxID=122646 RepID=A0ABD3IES7_9MARC
MAYSSATILPGSPLTGHHRIQSSSLSSISAASSRVSSSIHWNSHVGTSGRSLSWNNGGACNKVGSSRVRSGRPREVDFTLAEEEEEVGPNVVPAPPPSTGRIDIVVNKAAIRELDLSAAHAVLRKYVHQVGDNISEPAAAPDELFDRTIGFVIEYERDDPFDPRELSEMPDIRLWFVRLDAAYPWLPIVLDWKAGELARYAAMLVPHQMSKKQGLVFNPEALELFAMNKVFSIHPWLKARGVKSPHTKLTNMLRMIGLGVSKEFYALINRYPPPA